MHTAVPCNSEGWEGEMSFVSKEFLWVWVLGHVVLWNQIMVIKLERTALPTPTWVSRVWPALDSDSEVAFWVLSRTKWVALLSGLLCEWPSELLLFCCCECLLCSSFRTMFVSWREAHLVLLQSSRSLLHSRSLLLNITMTPFNIHRTKIQKQS